MICRMSMNQAPQCSRNPFHHVRRLAQMPEQVLDIPNHQGPPTIRILVPEAPAVVV
jgi:hypothetical protein